MSAAGSHNSVARENEDVLVVVKCARIHTARHTAAFFRRHRHKCQALVDSVARENEDVHAVQ